MNKIQAKSARKRLLSINDSKFQFGIANEEISPLVKLRRGPISTSGGGRKIALLHSYWFLR